MEHFLVLYIERQQDNSFPMTTKCIQTQAKLLYDKLLATRIYSDKGQRLTEFKDLTEQHIEGLLTGQDEQSEEGNEDRVVKCLFEASCDRLFRTQNELI